jgi:hypothetical protein
MPAAAVRKWWTPNPRASPPVRNFLIVAFSTSGMCISGDHQATHTIWA